MQSPEPTAGVPDALSRKLAAFKLVQKLINAMLVLAEDWEKVPEAVRDEFGECHNSADVLDRLVGLGLLTEYQKQRIEAGRTFGLVLSNYRILGRLGSGATGVVYLAEHMELRRQVAIKVVTLCDDASPSISKRFHNEMRMVAQLHHPNIVAALDAGKYSPKRGEWDSLGYLVMEYVPGRSLNDIVEKDGAMSLVETVSMADQLASALAEAHRAHLVHRDIKPSNIMRTPEGVSKLLDFGLARNAMDRQTEPGVLMGTVLYMAPEQLKDASAVDRRADIFALGGVMYFCLTGQSPFTNKRLLYQTLAHRLNQPTPSAQSIRADIPDDLNAVIMKMMATDPEDRYPTAEAVRVALAPFLDRGSQLRTPKKAAQQAGQTWPPPGSKKHRLLIVDDDPQVSEYCVKILSGPSVICETVNTGTKGVERGTEPGFDVVLLDIDLPDISGQVVCRQICERTKEKNLKIIMMSGRASADEMAQIMMAGADDFLSKPLSIAHLRARVGTAIRLKEEQDLADSLAKRMLELNSELGHHEDQGGHH
jgi:serine/threonine protein kinase